MNENNQNMIISACQMYSTAANLMANGLVLDANSLAEKATLLIDKALEEIIFLPEK